MKIPDPIYDQYYFSSPENQEAILRVVENLLAEQKKELIEKLDEMAFKENVRYSSEQKRMSGRVGEKAWNSIIKEKDILVIRSSKLTQLELSKEYGVSRECISAIKNKRTWSHIK